jgi:two-component system LytT family response regulator
MAAPDVMPGTPIRVLIVDDEPAAREGLRHLLSTDPEVSILGECANGREALTEIRRAAPDVLFLDVQMPGLDGFGMLRELGPDRVPVVVFVTAYDQYALHAFDVRALDYLLKPFSDERFQEALARAKAHVRRGRLGELGRRLAALVAELEQPAPATAELPPSTPAAGGGGGTYLDRLVIKSGGRVTLLRVNDIDWIDADGDYVRIHVGRQWHLLRETMKNLESQLDPRRFVRIHRSTIVNLERVKELQPFFRGEYVLVLHEGTTLKLSRGYREHLERMLGRGF